MIRGARKAGWEDQTCEYRKRLKDPELRMAEAFTDVSRSEKGWLGRQNLRVSQEIERPGTKNG